MSLHTADAPFIKDADLHAYLDGELTTAAIPTVEARLSADIEARILMKSLEIQRDALQSKFPLPDACPKTKAMVDAVLCDRGGAVGSDR
jgi:anti-sigma factor RsiW